MDQASGLSNWPRDVTSRIRLPGWHNSNRSHAGRTQKTPERVFRRLKEANLRLKNRVTSEGIGISRE